MGLDTVELVMAIEEEFCVQIPDADAAHMRTPRDVIEYLSEACTGMQKTVIAQRVKEIVIKQLGISEKAYREDARFVEDYGAD